MSEGLIINAGVFTTVLSGIVVVVIGLLSYKHLTREFKILLFFFIYATMSNLTIVGTALLNINNLWLFHLYTVFEFFTILWVLSFWQQSRGFRKFLYLSILIFTLFWLSAKFTFESIRSYDTVTSTVAHVFIIPVALYSLYKISISDTISILKSPRFWVCVGVLIYSTGNVFWLALGNEISVWPQAQMLTAWGIHWMLDILANLFFAGGFWWQTRR